MNKRKQINAFMNHGRWIFYCPRCGVGLPANEDGVVCPSDWPGINAMAFQQIENGLLRPVHDMAKINETRMQAEERGELYFPVFPAQRSEIEEILRMRPSAANMNWIPEETLEILRDQNVAHGDPLPKQRKK